MSEIPPQGFLCQHCQHGPLSREAWKILNPKQVVEAAQMGNYYEQPQYSYEMAFKTLKSSVLINCWWCSNIYDRIGSDFEETLSEDDVLLFCMDLSIPGRVVPPRIDRLSVFCKIKGKDEGGRCYEVGLFTRSHFGSRYFLADNQKGFKDFDPKLASQWIQECRQEHVGCKAKRGPNRPTRLIAVSTDLKIHLVTKYPAGADYAFLSYRWGGPQPLVLETDTVSAFSEDIPFQSLPATLQDAVKVVRSLGISYIWIDALCIVQNCPDDVTKEVSQMSLYVRQAVIVIQPSGLASVKEHFLAGDNYDAEPIETRKPGFLELSIFDTDEHNFTIHLDTDPNWYCALAEQINSRGWVVQERLLCPCVLIFPSKGGMIWQCEELESRHGRLHYGFAPHQGRHRMFSAWNLKQGSLPKSALTPEVIFDAWITIVDDYSIRNLTDPHDKLTAISALAQFFSYEFGHILGKYCAGLWYNYIDRFLHWRNDWGDSNTNFKISLPPKRAPSWSWATTDNAMYWLRHKETEDSYFRLRVLDCETYLATPHLPFGRVTGGRLTLECIVAEVILHPKGHVFDLDWEAEATQSVVGIPNIASNDVRHGQQIGYYHLDAIEYSLTHITKYPAIPLHTRQCLILRDTGNATLERIGILDLSIEAEMDLLHDWKSRFDRTICVIE